jgi:hypothetical protein
MNVKKWTAWLLCYGSVIAMVIFLGAIIFLKITGR